MKIFNKKARFEYTILESLEAGIMLNGAEVKGVKSGHADLNDSFAKIQNGELFLKNLFIPPYQPAADKEYDPRRDRKLLVHHEQIQQLASKLTKGGMALIAVSMYTVHNYIKVELALAQSKKKYDHRRAIKEKDEKRKLEQDIKKY